MKGSVQPHDPVLEFMLHWISAQDTDNIYCGWVYKVYKKNRTVIVCRMELTDCRIHDWMDHCQSLGCHHSASPHISSSKAVVWFRWLRWNDMVASHLFQIHKLLVAKILANLKKIYIILIRSICNNQSNGRESASMWIRGQSCVELEECGQGYDPCKIEFTTCDVFIIQLCIVGITDIKHT